MKIKIAIIVLSVLLAVSLLVLGGMVLHNHLSEGKSTEAVVPFNVITDEKEPNSPQADAAATDIDQTVDTGTALEKMDPSFQNANTNTGTENTNVSLKTGRAGGKAAAEDISLHKRNIEDNMTFRVENMFPGDRETKCFCVRVFHKGKVTLRFHADIRPGHEKLAEVLRCRVVLPEENNVLYDGLMRDMPGSLNHILNTDRRTTSETYYEVTAYLETSAGNECMDQSLAADFRWWVEKTGHSNAAGDTFDPQQNEIENLTSPNTGDPFDLYLWAGMAFGSLLLAATVLLKKSKKENTSNEQ